MRSSSIARSLVGLGVAALLLAPALAQAQVTTACKVQAAHLLETYLNSPAGGDNDFFTSQSGTPPNLIWVMDTSGSMRAMGQLPEPGAQCGESGQPPCGCSDSYYNSFAYNPATTYGDFDPRDDNWGGWPGLFPNARVFEADACTDCVGFDEFPDDGGDDDADGEYIDDYCSDTSDPSECSSCLRTRGYWRHDGTADTIALLGNFLRVYPPKYVMARKAFKEVMRDNRKVRMGTVIFSSNGGAWLSAVNPSCNLAGPNASRSSFDSNRSPMSRAIEGLTAASFSSGTPLTKTLMNVAEWYTRADEAFEDWGWSAYTNTDFKSKSNCNDNSICFRCQVNAVALITDGMPNTENSGVPDSINAAAVSEPTLFKCMDGGVDKCAGQKLHKMAHWLYNHDLRPRDPPTDGDDWDGEKPQNLSVYTVGFALNHPLLEKTAELTESKYYSPRTAEDLKQAMRDIVEDVMKRSNTFTSSNLSTVQSQQTQGVVVPKFTPQEGDLWQGELFRFEFVSEFVIDQDLDNDASTSPGYKSEFFLVDADCETYDYGVASCVPVREATLEDVEADTTHTLKMGRFYKQISFENETLRSPAQPAVPYWEANDMLTSSRTDGEFDVSGPDDRRIYTAIDSNNDGKWEMVSFDTANLASLKPYLGLEGNRLCEGLGFYVAELNGGTLPSGMDPFTTEHCAKYLIQWVRGCKLGPNPSTCVAREYVLSDIFHSSPIIMEPPTPKALLNTVFRNSQTIVTLGEDKEFASDTATGEPDNAYEAFAEKYATRDRVIIVGSNGGMLHGFHGGACSPGGLGGLVAQCDRGTGEELWAFIPPDLLPKLKQLLGIAGVTKNFPADLTEAEKIDYGLQGRHAFFVDGTPWIRNVWVDGMSASSDGLTPGQPDYKRQTDEFRTVAVVGERRGGNRYFALDVTESYDSSYVPKLLWIHPDFGTAAEVQVGLSWNDITPLPPPIGPIKYETGDTDPAWTERWIVAVPAGWDPANRRGQGWYVLDAWTGESLWNYTPDKDLNKLDAGGDSTGDEKNLKFLKYSIAATPTLVAWGDSERQTFGNLYFDTLIVGDTGGQLWVGRFGDPDPTTWDAGRVFEAGKDGEDASNRPWDQPVFQPAQLSVMPSTSYLRTYFGTGNRAHLRDPVGGECSNDNPAACALSNKCNKVELDFHKLEVGSFKNETKVKIENDPKTEVTQNIEVGTPGTSCPKVTIKYKEKFDDCRLFSGTNDKVDHERHMHLECNWNTDRYVCNGAKVEGIDEGFIDDTASDENQGSDADLAAVACTDSGSVTTKARFYSIRVFDGSRKPFKTHAAAEDFDDDRLTTGLVADAASKVVPVDPDPNTASPVSESSPGWYYEYPYVPERTASPSVTAARCVIWSSMRAPCLNPGCTGSDSVCPGDAPGTPATTIEGEACLDNVITWSKGDPCGASATVSKRAFMYFRDFVTGKANCLPNTPDNWESDRGAVDVGEEPQPPPPPQLIVQISESGATAASVTTTEGSSVSVATNDEILKEFSVIDVPRDLHDWRHAACEGDAVCE